MLKEADVWQKYLQDKVEAALKAVLQDSDSDTDDNGLDRADFDSNSCRAEWQRVRPPPASSAAIPSDATPPAVIPSAAAASAATASAAGSSAATASAACSSAAAASAAAASAATASAAGSSAAAASAAGSSAATASAAGPSAAAASAAGASAAASSSGPAGGFIVGERVYWICSDDLRAWYGDEGTVEGYRRLYDGSDVLWVRFGIFQLISLNPADEVAKLSREPPPPLPGCDLAPLAGGFHAGDVVYFLGENQSFNGVKLVRGRRGVVAGPSLATAPVAGLSVRFDGISTSFACPLDLLSRTSPTQHAESVDRAWDAESVARAWVRSGAAPSAATPSVATPPAVTLPLLDTPSRRRSEAAAVREQLAQQRSHIQTLLQEADAARGEAEELAGSRAGAEAASPRLTPSAATASAATASAATASAATASAATASAATDSGPVGGFSAEAASVRSEARAEAAEAALRECQREARHEEAMACVRAVSRRCIDEAREAADAATRAADEARAAAELAARKAETKIGNLTRELQASAAQASTSAAAIASLQEERANLTAQLADAEAAARALRAENAGLVSSAAAAASAAQAESEAAAEAAAAKADAEARVAAANEAEERSARECAEARRGEAAARALAADAERDASRRGRGDSLAEGARRRDRGAESGRAGRPRERGGRFPRAHPGATAGGGGGEAGGGPVAAAVHHLRECSPRHDVHAVRPFACVPGVCRSPAAAGAVPNVLRRDRAARSRLFWVAGVSA